MKVIFFLILFFIQCYLNPSNPDQDGKNIFEPSKILGFVLYSELQQESISKFQIEDLKVESKYPSVTFSWTKEPANLIGDVTVEVGVSDKPILNDEDCRSRLFFGLINSFCNPDFIQCPAISADRIYFANSQSFDPRQVYTEYNPYYAAKKQICTFCTQGATLYFCARPKFGTNIPSKGIQTHLNPWNGATVKTIYQ